MYNAARNRKTTSVSCALSEPLPLRSLQCRTRVTSVVKIRASSIHRVPGGVSVAGDNINFLVFAFLVFLFQLAAIGCYDLHLQLTVGAVQLVVGRPISDRILIADISGNIVEQLRRLALEARKVSAASGHGGE